MPARIPDTTRTTACVLCCCFPSPTPPPSPSPLCGPRPTSVKFCPHRSPSRLPPSSVPQPAPSTCAAPFSISHDSFVPSPPTASITSVVAMPAHLACRQCDVQHQRRAQRSGPQQPFPSHAAGAQCTDNTEVMRSPRSARTSHPASTLDDGPWCEGTTRSGRRHPASRAFTLHRASCRWTLGMGCGNSLCFFWNVRRDEPPQSIRGSAGRMSVDG
ncbi:hypothetical protein B0H14DRAFT_2829715 [Mycena olivaceomarginata]|nr:hypothetical protein B0H14DRAFT_2829715 [Mycena olivaceomarginata]